MRLSYGIVLSSFAFLLLSNVGVLGVPVGTVVGVHSLAASNQPNSICTSQLTQSVREYEATINSTQAIATAVGSPQFASLVTGRAYSFLSISPTFNYNPSNCAQITLTALTVAFSLPTAMMSACGILISEGIQVSENPSLDQVTASQIDNTSHCKGSIIHGFGGQGHSGYYVWDDSSGVRKTMTYSTTYYYQPYVSNVPGYCTQSPAYQCTLSVWSGIFNAVSGGELVQTGTDGNIVCPWGLYCNSPSYDAWWEVIHGSCCGSVSCSGITNGAGYEYEAIAENGPAWGGNPDQWQMYIVNDNTDQVCFSGTQTFTSTYYANAAETVFEVPGINGGTAPLPSFTEAVNFDNIACYTTNLCAGFSTYYNDGWGSTWNMNNPCNGQPNVNIALGGLSSDTFTSTYQNSCGT